MIKLPTSQDFIDALQSNESIEINGKMYKIDNFSRPSFCDLPEGFSVFKVTFRNGTKVTFKEAQT